MAFVLVMLALLAFGPMIFVPFHTKKTFEFGYCFFGGICATWRWNHSHCADSLKPIMWAILKKLFIFVIYAAANKLDRSCLTSILHKFLLNQYTLAYFTKTPMKKNKVLLH